MRLLGTTGEMQMGTDYARRVAEERGNAPRSPHNCLEMSVSTKCWNALTRSPLSPPSRFP